MQYKNRHLHGAANRLEKSKKFSERRNLDVTRGIRLTHTIFSVLTKHFDGFEVVGHVERM